VLFEHEQQLNRIEQKVDAIMAAVEDIAAATAALNTGQAQLAAFLTDLSNDVNTISQNGGAEPDTTALNEAVAAYNATAAQIPAAQSALDALANPPAATPAPTPAPSFRPAGN
jgi:uncharacterized phage infection (PIP) family protein YhgE